MQERVHIVQPPVCDTSHCDQQLEAVPYWHMGKHITKVSDKAAGQWRNRFVQAYRQQDIIYKEYGAFHMFFSDS